MATIAELLDKIAKKIATQKDLQEYASLLGKDAGIKVSKAILEDTVSEDEAEQIALQMLRDNHGKIMDYADAVQNASYEAEGLHLKAIHPEFDAAEVRDALRKIAEKDLVTEPFIVSNMELASQRAADRHMQINAEAANKAGLQALVSREYVSGSNGAHTTSNHPKTCTFCASRDTHGKMIPYPEAYANGIFERHPNCRCIITYISKRGEITTQNRFGGNWSGATDAREAQTRRGYNTEEGGIPSFEEIKSRIRKGRLPNVDLEIYGLEFVEDERPYFPPDHTMAGKGCKTGRKIDDINRLKREYRYFTTDAGKWSKQKARYQVYDEYGQIREIEIHWYQHPEVGKVEDKIKFDEYDRMFVDEWER